MGKRRLREASYFAKRHPRLWEQRWCLEWAGLAPSTRKTHIHSNLRKAVGARGFLFRGKKKKNRCISGLKTWAASEAGGEGSLWARGKFLCTALGPPIPTQTHRPGARRLLLSRRGQSRGARIPPHTPPGLAEVPLPSPQLARPGLAGGWLHLLERRPPRLAPAHRESPLSAPAHRRKGREIRGAGGGGGGREGGKAFSARRKQVARREMQPDVCPQIPPAAATPTPLQEG